MYRTCEELPLYNFIKIAVHNDLSWLNADAPEQGTQLKQVWEAILEEYNSLSGNTKSAHVLSLVKEITILNNKLYVIQSCVDFLQHTRSEELIQILKDMHFRFTYSPETMQKDLKLTVSSAKTLLMQRREAQKEYEVLQGKEEPLTEKDFYALLTQLSKYNGYKIDAKQTSVLEFTVLMDQYNQSIPAS